MENKFTKKHIISAYNIHYKGHIVAGVDTYFKEGTSYIVEVTPYGDEAEAAGLKLADQQDWTIHAEAKKEEGQPKPSDTLKQMLGTIFGGYAAMSDQFAVKKRKDVYEMGIEKNGSNLSLAMVYEYERFVASDTGFSPALYIHDTKEFDIWRLAINSSEEVIYQTVYLNLKSSGYRSRR
ncbi:hypothetical protein A0256_14320 [Mucilaginibacter sp. PAMC 26640]|nr:hypothetical protein A0256_14320 [Mucilaginibacter sp. PAMC 26640]